MIRLALIHPQPIYCQGVALLLDSFDDLELVASVSEMRELIHQHQGAGIDIILWHLSGHHSLVPGLQLVREHFPLAKVMVLTEASHGLYSGFLINLGADGVIGSHISIDQLRQSLISLSRTYAPPPSSNHVQDFPDNMEGFPSYNAQELQILQMVSEGLSTSQIAGKLHQTVKEISAQIAKLKQKLKAKNKAMLIRKAQMKQLIPVKTIKNKL